MSAVMDFLNAPIWPSTQGIHVTKYHTVPEVHTPVCQIKTGQKPDVHHSRRSVGCEDTVTPVKVHPC